MTQLGRVEAARHGVRLNTDAIDNSAGVDTSDHEVNIKILLDGLVRSGILPLDDRNALLAEMTDDVAAAGAARTTTARTSCWAMPAPAPRASSPCTSG